MKSLRNHIEENANIARGARDDPRRDREPAAEAEPVRVILGLDAAAAVPLPADIDIETKAELMNAFWGALVQTQDRDVIVVALFANGEP